MHISKILILIIILVINPSFAITGDNKEGNSSDFSYQGELIVSEWKSVTSFDQNTRYLSMSQEYSCPPINCVAGKNVGVDFMEGVLSKIKV